MFTKAAIDKSHGAHSEKLKRRPNKKTKTGCKTCRIRGVKCDEEKPSCKRCVTFRVRCDDYAEPNPKIPHKKRLPPPLLPLPLLPLNEDQCVNGIPLQSKLAAKWEIPRIYYAIHEELSEYWSPFLKANLSY